MREPNPFKSAREYVQSAGLSDYATDALTRLVVKRNGIYSLRKTKPKSTRDRLTFEAWKVANHAARWGDLSAWREGLTAELMLASDADREHFDRLFDEILEAAKERRNAR